MYCRETGWEVLNPTFFNRDRALWRGSNVMLKTPLLAGQPSAFQKGVYSIELVSWLAKSPDCQIRNRLF